MAMKKIPKMNYLFMRLRSLRVGLIIFVSIVAGCAAPKLVGLQHLTASTTTNLHATYRDRLDWSDVVRRDPNAPVHIPNSYALRPSDTLRLKCNAPGAMLSIFYGADDFAPYMLRDHPQPRLPLAFFGAVQTTGLSCNGGDDRVAVTLCTGDGRTCIPPVGHMTWGTLRAKFGGTGITPVLEPSGDPWLAPGDEVAISYEFARLGERGDVLGPFGRDLQVSVDQAGYMKVPTVSRAPHAQGVDPLEVDFLALAAQENQSIRVHQPGICEAKQRTRLGFVTTCLNVLPMGDGFTAGPFHAAVLNHCKILGFDPELYVDPSDEQSRLLNLFRTELQNPVFHLVLEDGSRYTLPFVEGNAVTATVADAIQKITGEYFLYPASEFKLGGFLTVQPANSQCNLEAKPFYFKVKDRSGPDLGPVRLRRGDTVNFSFGRPRTLPGQPTDAL